ncbi:MAG TPA: BPSS1780 family membrane protein [Burkholderiaceae bacterium]|nr:BPSS1780 family membrane protein [Burkholderiaceae bacterium]
MKLQTVPPRQGTLWVREGFRVFFKRPMSFAGLFAAFLFAVFSLALLPFIGPFLVLALLPLVSLAFMIATRRVVDGGFATPAVFVEPFRAPKARRIAMLQLGLIYAAATFLIMWLADVVDGGAFEALMNSLPAGTASSDAVASPLVSPRLELGLLLRFGLAALLSVPFWHAPALVHWDGHGCAKALFSSTVACWRNKGAFTIYSLTWAGVIMVLGALTNLVLALFGQFELIALTAVPLSLILSTVFYASLYFTFADCFGASDTRIELPPPTLLKGPP